MKRNIIIFSAIVIFLIGGNVVYNKIEENRAIKQIAMERQKYGGKVLQVFDEVMRKTDYNSFHDYFGRKEDYSKESEEDILRVWFLEGHYEIQATFDKADKKTLTRLTQGFYNYPKTK